MFAGGFLGLDNIGVFDRSAPLPTGGSLEQADGTAWMAFYCQNMLEIALILAETESGVRGIRLQASPALHAGSPMRWTASASNHDEMWDEEDGFFYDVFRLPGRLRHGG